MADTERTNDIFESELLPSGAQDEQIADEQDFYQPDVNGTTNDEYAEDNENKDEYLEDYEDDDEHPVNSENDDEYVEDYGDDDEHPVNSENDDEYVEDYEDDDEYVEDYGDDDDEAPIKPLKPSQAAKKRRKKSANPFIAAMSNLFPWKGDSRAEVVRKSVFLSCLVVLGVSASFVLDYFRGANDSKEVYENFKNIYHDSYSYSEVSGGEFEWPLLPEAEKVLSINSDIVGWITIDDTHIDLPVLQAADNDYYLDRDVYKNESHYGAIFLDYRNKFTATEQSDNLVIYGHDTTTNDMFGDLDQYHFQSIDFLKKHPSFRLNSNYKRSEYIIFAVVITNALERDGKIWPYHNTFDFANESEFDAFVLEAKKRSVFKTYLDMEYGDKLATLSTCATTVFEDARLVIIGREVREGEKPDAYVNNYVYNPNPLYPDRWYKIRGGSYSDDPTASY